MLTIVRITANNPTYAKSNGILLNPSLKIVSLLTASVVYDMGFTFATACSQSGIRLIGKKALLANIRGRVIRLMTAWGVSILVALRLMAMNIEDKPMPIRNTTANTPSRLSMLKFVPNWRPKIYAIIITIAAWNMDRNVAERTFERMMTDRDTGVLRTLFMKPSRRSQTTDIPLKAVVKSVVKTIIPIAMYEK